MTFTNYARGRVALSLGSELSNNYVSYFNVGSGSGTALATQDELVNEWGRFAITGSPNFDTAQQVTFTGDLNAIAASGLILQEFGLLTSGPALTGSNWSRVSLGSITFDGTNELKLESTILVS